MTTETHGPRDTRGLALAGLSAADRALLTRQLDGLRLFWRHRRATEPGARVAVCGAFAVVEYGVLPCARPGGHGGAHVCAGAHGAIEWWPSGAIAGTDGAGCRPAPAAGQGGTR